MHEFGHRAHELPCRAFDFGWDAFESRCASRWTRLGPSRSQPSGLVVPPHGPQLRYGVKGPLPPSEWQVPVSLGPWLASHQHRLGASRRENVMVEVLTPSMPEQLDAVRDLMRTFVAWHRRAISRISL